MVEGEDTTEEALKWFTNWLYDRVEISKRKMSNEIRFIQYPSNE
jgi:hypothetical protein